MNLICILGRQPALGFAELESRFGAEKLSPAREDIAELKDIDVAPDVFDQLGGVQKAGKVISVADTTDWQKLQSSLKKALQELINEAPEGKITLGISVYGLQVNPSLINASALTLKKAIKQTGRSARVVPNKENELNTAQVLHNKLDAPNGIELILVRSGQQTIIASTAWVQDIEAYRKRDQERPFRDSRVGMLPPKLAQIIINLATGSKSVNSLLDPFCGTGVLLQEALLMGIEVQGTDLEPRMIDFSKKNLEWLNASSHYSLEVADATDHKWTSMPDTIACETYLGRPLTSLPDRETLLKIIHDCNVIHKKFLQNVAQQTQKDFKMCIAVPAWRSGNDFKHLPLLDHLEELGYNRLSLTHAKTEDLVYHRDGQVVAREIVLLKRI